MKADHIRQINSDDLWISEGGGMMPKRDLYERFLSTARERRTACVKFQLILTIITDFRNQKAPCDNKFKAVEQWCILKHVTLWELSPLLSLGMDVLLPQQYSQPLSWRTTEECGLFPSTSPQNNKCGSRWPGDSLCIRHRLYPLRSFHIPNWAFTAARREVWFCNWSLPRSWTQRRMLFPLLSRIHSWNWSFCRQNIGKFMGTHEYNHSFGKDGDTRPSGRVDRRSCKWFKLP